MTTYTRRPERVPATCPCCLKTHKTKRTGRMFRHGWKETGRRVGEYGQGFQWGNCHGWSLRPLEETDADALDILNKIHWEIRRTRDRIALVESPDFGDEFRRTIKRRSYSWADDVDAKLCAFVEEAMGDNVEIRDGSVRVHAGRVYTAGALVFDITIERGFEGLAPTFDELVGLYGSAVVMTFPSWEAARAEELEALAETVSGLDRARRAIEEAIEYHRENPTRPDVDLAATIRRYEGGAR